ncbi:MAG: flippase-like domain-containing protein [Candidatus Latescibacteria bacterium]|nr:flippase-like domain-containing protein [bacterium]MBD3424874.1 flippase-like domain-containing protein [Candidatus Latescibacterota bacterium]
MKAGFKSNWKILLGLAVSALFLYLAFRKADFREMFLTLKQADYSYVIPAVALSLLSLAFRAIRWKYLFRPIKRISFMNLLSAASIGYMANSVMPARLGEIVRAYAIGMKEDISKTSSFATIVVARIYDGITILFFLFITLSRFPFSFPPWFRNVIIVAVLFYLLAIVFIMLLKYRPDKAFAIASVVTRFLPEKLQQTLMRVLNSFVVGLDVLKSARDAVIAGFYSVLVWLPNAAIIFVLARSFDITLPFSGAMLILVIVTLGIMIPSAPAFVGTVQYCCVIGLGFFGVARSQALSFSVIYHLCTFLPITITGFIFLLKEGYSFMELKRSAEEEEPVT